MRKETYETKVTNLKKIPNSEKKGKKELKGIGGWLWFFALILIVLRPLIILAQLFSDSSADFEIFIINLALIIFGIIVGISIFKKKKRAIIWVKEFLIAYLTLAIIDAMGFVIDPTLFAGSSYNPIANIVFALIWLSYLNSSKRVENTFEERRLNWKRTFIIIIITAVSPFILGFSYGYFSEPSLDTTPISPQHATGELSPNYVVFRPFTNQYVTNELKLEFSSNLPMNVYFVPTEKDYDNFMQGEQYNIYQGCFFESQTFWVIDCNVSGGGIIIRNPNYQNITYNIKKI